MSIKGYYYARLTEDELGKIEKAEQEINSTGGKKIILLAFSKDQQ